MRGKKRSRCLSKEEGELAGVNEHRAAVFRGIRSHIIINLNINRHCLRVRRRPVNPQEHSRNWGRMSRESFFPN